jgi:hypothetical protein
MLDGLLTQAGIIDEVTVIIVEKELAGWKRQQQLSGNGGDFDTSHLDILQN